MRQSLIIWSQLLASLLLMAFVATAQQPPAAPHAPRPPRTEQRDERNDERRELHTRQHRPSEGETAERRERDASRTRDREVGRPAPGRHWGQDFEGQLAQDLAWLRERGLERYADRLEEARKSEEPGSRFMVMSAQVRIRHLRRLWQEKPEEAQNSLEELRLGLKIHDLASAARQADGPERHRLVQQLRQALDGQFEARLAAQRALIDAMERRLEQLRQDIRRQEELRARIVEQRQRDLLDPERPLSEPSLLMPGGPGHREGGPAGRDPAPDRPEAAGAGGSGAK
jgi:hypothetical protein